MAKKGGLGGPPLGGRPVSQTVWSGFSIAEEQRQAAEMEQLVGGAGTVQELPVVQLDPNPYQARTDFTNIEELADAIRQLGFFGTLPVRPHPAAPGRYQIVYGERRLRAARHAGLTRIPCIVHSYTDEQMVEIGLAENIQREDLNPLDEAAALQGFVSQRGYSIRQLGERIGKGKSWVQERLALLEMPSDVQEMLRQRPDTLRAARGLARIEQPAQRTQLIQGLLEGAISSRDVRQGGRTTSPGPALEPRREATARRQVEAIQRSAQRIRGSLRAIQTLLPELEPEARPTLKETLRELRRLLDEIEGQTGR